MARYIEGSVNYLAECSYRTLESTLASFNLHSSKPQLLGGELRVPYNENEAQVQTTNMATFHHS